MTDRILILGGTAEASELAGRMAADQRFHVVLSLAGRTENPVLPDVEVRTGGFGGAAGLGDYLVANEIAYMVDATHPYATTISRNAVEAREATGLPGVRMARPDWEPVEGDRWRPVASETEAAEALPPGATAFLALGRQYLAPFTDRDDVRFVYRTADGQDTPLPDTAIRIVGRPSAQAASEIILFRTHGITHVVSRNSGGEAGYGKIAAARQLGLPVLMIERPASPAGRTVDSVDGAMIEIERHFS